jgi:nanoRNase/pAp phosphatase (c-di-AMP/oligoRNAs hydrolase)
MVYQQVKNKYWTISLYTQKDIDVSVIATKWKGGGHRKACGWQVKDITKVIGAFNV